MPRDPLADPEPLIRRVYAYVAYRIGDGPDAEDVTSETFARALRYRDSYDPKKGEPIAWLLGIARRCIADAHAVGRQDELRAVDQVAAPGDLEADEHRAGSTSPRRARRSTSATASWSRSATAPT